MSSPANLSFNDHLSKPFHKKRKQGLMDNLNNAVCLPNDPTFLATH